VLDGSERVIGVMVLDIGRGQIQAISSIVNPDKLAHLSSTADLANRFCTRDRVASNLDSPLAGVALASAGPETSA
jgi:hypothetical protein